MIPGVRGSRRAVLYTASAGVSQVAISLGRSLALPNSFKGIWIGMAKGPLEEYQTAEARGQRQDRESSSAGLRLSQVAVEPVGELRQVLVQAGPAVPGTLLDDELRLDPGLLELLDDQLRLLERDELVLVAVDDQRRRVVGRDVGRSARSAG